MAIVNISVDTEAGTISASVNGTDVPNVDNVFVYRTTEYEYGEDPEKVVRVEITGNEKTDDVKKMWRICASEVKTTEDSDISKDFLACRTSK